MIRAYVDVDGLRLDISGHAGLAPEGQDIVCAAVSALAYTLAQNLALTLDAQDFTAELTKGRARIEARPPAALRERCRDIFMVIANGLCLLAEHYGQYMQLEGA